MAPPAKYQKAKKICSICFEEFETLLNHKFEKTYCSRTCLGKSRIVLNEADKKIRAKKYAREYRRTHPMWVKDTRRRARQRMKANNPELLIFLETKKRAKKRGIKFELKVSDIVIPKTCPILEIELSFGIGKVQDSSPSLDRIIPDNGYVAGNCFIISSKANRMKQENTLETLEKIVSYMKERMK